MTSPVHVDPGSGRWDAAVVFVLAVVAYRLLAQGVLHGDAYPLLFWAHEGKLDHAQHLAYLPALHAGHAVLGPLGASYHDVGMLMSQVGAAAGVALLHVATRRFGFARGDAWLVSAMVGTCPSIVFFATVLELHAPYFAFVGLAGVATASLSRRPTAGRAAIVGAATALAFCWHASGILLPIPMLLLFLARCPRVTRRALWLAGVAGAVHGLLVVLVPRLLRGAGTSADLGSVVDFLAAWGDHAAALVAIPEVVWREWGWPYMPLSVLWLAGFATARARRLAVATALALVPYLAATCRILGTAVEHGAYQQPLAWPAALVLVGSRQRWLAVLTTVGLAVVAALTVCHGNDARVRAYVDGFRELAAGRPALLLIGGTADLEACYVAMPGVAAEMLMQTRYMEADLVDASLRALDARIDRFLARGDRVFATGAAVAELMTPRPAGVQPGLAKTLAHLRARYATEQVAAHGFVAWRLRPRQ